MTDERYRVMNHDDYELDYVADSHHQFKKMDLYDCCEIMNENEQLKLDLKVANDGADLYKDINEALEKENKELKKEIEELEERIDSLEARLWNCRNCR